MKLIDYLNDYKEKLQIYKEIINFDIEDYYKNKKGDFIRSDIAIYIITPKQSLGIAGKGTSIHAFLLEKICSFIFKNNDINFDDVNFIKYSRQLDSIIFRMFDVDEQPKIIEHYPEQINEYQLKEKIKFYSKINEINKKRDENKQIVKVGPVGDIEINDEFIERLKKYSHTTEYDPTIKETLIDKKGK